MKTKKIKIKDNGLIKGKFKITTLKAGTAIILRESKWIDNLVVSNTNRGINLILKGMMGNKTYGIQITKAKIGDDNTAPTDNDTDLGNVLVDNIAVGLYNENSTTQLLIKFFISDADLPNDDYKEFGIFCGTQLFARSIISPTYTKSSNEDTIVEYLINYANT